uniref:Uncharacterized protein n=1 Tax=Oryza sativa subsp. japonica TaxID=39947 RepID=Q5VPX1_ORYSJ|nr:hypothetical protein [Oryza sativa Japonica Group]
MNLAYCIEFLSVDPGPPPMHHQQCHHRRVSPHHAAPLLVGQLSPCVPECRCRDSLSAAAPPPSSLRAPPHIAVLPVQQLILRRWPRRRCPRGRVHYRHPAQAAAWRRGGRAGVTV